MQKIKHIDDRLVRWGCWCTAGGQLHSEGVSSAYRGEKIACATDDTSRWSGRVAFDNLEAEETNRLVAQLPPDERRAVHETYIKHLTGTERQHARALRVSQATYRNWLCRAHSLLDAKLRDARSRKAA